MPASRFFLLALCAMAMQGAFLFVHQLRAFQHIQRDERSFSGQGRSGCGTSWDDADANCHKPCAAGDEECPDGMRCFFALAREPCLKAAGERKTASAPQSAEGSGSHTPDPPSATRQDNVAAKEEPGYASALPASDVSQRCGRTFDDANQHCRALCPGNRPCPPGLACWSSLSPLPCAALPHAGAGAAVTPSDAPQREVSQRRVAERPTAMGRGADGGAPERSLRPEHSPGGTAPSPAPLWKRHALSGAEGRTPIALPPKAALSGSQHILPGNMGPSHAGPRLAARPGGRVDSNARVAASGGDSAQSHLRSHADVVARHLTLRPAAASNSSITDNELLHRLRRLPRSYGPDGGAWNNSIAACLAIRDENVTDIREWLHYHRWLGVDHVFLTENNSDRPIGDDLRDFVDAGFLTYKTESQPYAMMKIYLECFLSQRENFNWMAYLDADEYLVLRDRSTTLKGLLDQFKRRAGLSVHWVRFGSHHRLTRPRGGGVMRTYLSCQEQPAELTKIIANLFFMSSPASNPHTARFWGGLRPVNEANVTAAINHGTSQPRATIKPASINRIALFHYQTKSAEDFLIKMRRGGGDGIKKEDAYFHNVNRLAQSSGPLCHELEKVADECCPAAARGADAVDAVVTAKLERTLLASPVRL